MKLIVLQAYLREIAYSLLDSTGADVSLSSTCRFLRKMRFTRQRLKVIAKQRCFSKISICFRRSVYDPEMFPEMLILDETDVLHLAIRKTTCENFLCVGIGYLLLLLCP